MSTRNKLIKHQTDHVCCKCNKSANKLCQLKGQSVVTVNFYCDDCIKFYVALDLIIPI